jgi:hypothetical protein
MTNIHIIDDECFIREGEGMMTAIMEGNEKSTDNIAHEYG